MAQSLGTAYVDIEPRADGFGSEVEKVLGDELRDPIEKTSRQVEAGLGGAFKKVGAVVAAAGIGAFFSSAISAAGDLGEQTSKVGVVFGSAADEVLAFGETATESMGASKLEALEAAGTFGNLLRSVGLADAEAASMSTTMIQLAGDMASFNNVPVAETLDAIRSGLVGETEPLKRFGVNMNEAALKAEALALGLDVTGATLDSNTKLQAAYSLILKQTTLAQGDFARTSESTSNQQRIFAAELENAKAELGEALLPALGQFLALGRDLLPVLTELGGTVAGIAGGASAAAGPVLDLLGSFAGSDIGQAAITMAGVAFAVDKITDAADGAFKAIKKLSTAGTLVSPMTIAMLGVGAAAAAITWKLQDNARKAEEAEERTEGLTTALTKSGDVGAVTAATYGVLADQAEKLATSAKDAADGTESLTSSWALGQLEAGGLVDELNKIGIGAEDVFDAVWQGGPALDGLRKRFEQQYRFTTYNADAMREFGHVIGEMEDAVEASRAGTEAAIESDLNRIVSMKQLEQATLDAAVAAHTAADGNVDWVAVGKELEPTLRDQLDVTSEMTDSALGLADAEGETAEEAVKLTAAEKELADAAAKLQEQLGLTEEGALELAEAQAETKQATEDHKAAEDALKGALDEASEAQQRYLDVAAGVPANVDDATSAVYSLRDSLVENSEAIGRGTAAFDGNSEAAIANRDALRDTLSAATDVVAGFYETESSAEAARAKQVELAESLYQTAMDAGLAEDEAIKLRDGVLNIPATRTTQVDVYEQGLADTQARIQAAADKEYAATLKVTPTLASVGVSPELVASIRAQMGLAPGAAAGAYVSAVPGGSLLWVGEGRHDEAIVPLTPEVLAGLDFIAQQGRQPARAGDTVVVNVDGSSLASRSDAERLGRVAGTAAAEVLERRRMAVSLRVGG